MWVMLEFVCEKCGHEFEELVKRSEIDQVRCPKCQVGSAQQVLANPKHGKHVSWSSWRVGHGD